MPTIEDIRENMRKVDNELIKLIRSSNHDKFYDWLKERYGKDQVYDWMRRYLWLTETNELDTDAYCDLKTARDSFINFQSAAPVSYMYEVCIIRNDKNKTEIDSAWFSNEGEARNWAQARIDNDEDLSITIKRTWLRKHWNEQPPQVEDEDPHAGATDDEDDARVIGDQDD